MAGIMGDISGRGPAGGGGEGKAQSYGWDRDLQAVPEFIVTGGTGWTDESQILAGLSVDAGALVVDTDPMVAAGADPDLEVYFRFQELDLVQANWARAVFELEKLSAGTQNHAMLTGQVNLYDDAENYLNRTAFRLGNGDGWGEVYGLEGGSNFTGINGNYLSAVIEAGGYRPVMVEVLEADATFSAFTDSVRNMGSRDALPTTPIGKIKALLGLLRYNDPHGERSHWKVHRFQIQWGTF